MNRKELVKLTTPTKTTDPTCIVCFNSLTVISIGQCDHTLCYKCSATCRVLCHDKKCPVCSCIMSKVFFTKKVDLFKNLDSLQHLNYNKKYGIVFDDYETKYLFEQLLSKFCTICEDRPTFEIMKQLVKHMEINHKLYTCYLCFNKLKIFTQDLCWYNSNEFSKHICGHVICTICGKQFYDTRAYVSHIKNEHFYCIICFKEDNIDIGYFPSFELLSTHYHDLHFYCEIGICKMVFCTSEELEDHKNQYHIIKFENTYYESSYEDILREAGLFNVRNTSDCLSRLKSFIDGLQSGNFEYNFPRLVDNTEHIVKKQVKAVSSFPNGIDIVIKTLDYDKNNVAIQKEATNDNEHVFKIPKFQLGFDDISNLDELLKMMNDFRLLFAPNNEIGNKKNPNLNNGGLIEGNSKNSKKIMQNVNSSTKINNHNSKNVNLTQCSSGLPELSSSVKTISNAEAMTKSCNNKKNELSLKLKTVHNQNMKYFHPIDWNERIRKFVNELNVKLKDNSTFIRVDKFNKFNSMYYRFMKHEISAHAFYTYCFVSIYPWYFKSFFMEMILLMTDIPKQQLLVMQYYGSKKFKFNLNDFLDIKKCKICGQILGISDLKYHYYHHKYDNKDNIE